MRGVVCGLMAVAAVSALSATGQIAATQPHKSGVDKPVYWAILPHTAVYMTTNVRTLADGSTITKASLELQARDSQGRTLTARTDVSQGKHVISGTQYSVADPVSQTYVDWASGSGQATVRAMQSRSEPEHHCVAAATPAPVTVEPAANLNAQESPERIDEEIVQMREMMRIERLNKPPSDPTIRRTQRVEEDLGKATVLGYPTHGHRTTSTTPADGAGSSAPIVETSERWIATIPVLIGLVVREVRDSPLMGRWTEELVEFDQDEPNPSLFKPPADYELVTNSPAVLEDRCSQSAAPPTLPAR